MVETISPVQRLAKLLPPIQAVQEVYISDLQMPKFLVRS
jgi:hypothetical protein